MVAVALALFVVNSRAFAADDAKTATHDGIVVSITSGKLVMTTKLNNESKEHSHKLAADTKLTLDGKACKAADIKVGTKIRVTTKKGESQVVSLIEAIDKNETFANTHDGSVVSITSSKLVMKNRDGKEHSHAVSADTTVSCDGQVCKFSDLKPGMRIRVTLESASPHAATRIEAIEKNLDFASL